MSAGLVGSERQVPDEERALGATRHGAAVDEHLIEGDGEGGVVAVNDHGSGVADQANVDAGGVQMHRGGVVVGRDHGYGLAPPVLLADVSERDALARVLWLRAAVDGVFRDVAEPAENGMRRIAASGDGGAAEGFTEGRKHPCRRWGSSEAGKEEVIGWVVGGEAMNRGTTFNFDKFFFYVDLLSNSA